MRINYVGNRNSEWQDNPMRCADITVPEDATDKEMALFERTLQMLKINGWDVDEVSYGWAMIAVEDSKEYGELVRDYKAIKNCVRNSMKYGF